MNSVIPFIGHFFERQKTIVMENIRACQGLRTEARYACKGIKERTFILEGWGEWWNCPVSDCGGGIVNFWNCTPNKGQFAHVIEKKNKVKETILKTFVDANEAWENISLSRKSGFSMAAGCPNERGKEEHWLAKLPRVKMAARRTSRPVVVGAWWHP